MVDLSLGALQSVLAFGGGIALALIIIKIIEK